LPPAWSPGPPSCPPRSPRSRRRPRIPSAPRAPTRRAPPSARWCASSASAAAARPASGSTSSTGPLEFVRGDDEQRSAVGLWLGRADADGLRVERVTADGPAARAGVAAGDRLTAVNGTSLRVDRGEADDPILSAVPARRLERAVGRLAPGSEVELRVARDGRERAVRVRTVAPTALADRGGEPAVVREYRTLPGRAAPFAFGPDVAPFRAAPARPPLDDAAVADLRRRARGLADSARTRAAARPVLGLTLETSRGGRDTLGLFVSAVAAGGPAERAGVVEGDRIAGVNGVDLRVPRDERDDAGAADARRARFTRELARLRPGDRVTLRVYGDGRWRTVTATAARAADVYRAAAPFGPGAGGAEWLFPDVGPGDAAFRGLRAAPMPNVLLRPLPPRAPRPVRRTVLL
jgi:membrane-associated protease RseP (regulator of RpoE activity)